MRRARTLSRDQERGRLSIEMGLAVRWLSGGAITLRRLGGSRSPSAFFTLFDVDVAFQNGELWADLSGRLANDVT